MTNSPTVWRRWLAFELRRLREERGLAQKQVGKACGWSGARLSYLENLQQNVTEDDLAKLLPLYEVPRDRWGDFYEAARRAREKDLWERYDLRVPEWLTLYVGLEQGASAIRWVETLSVPALLQTPDYATATIRTDVVPRTEQQIARIVELRMARRAVLTRREPPLNLSVVMDESVLYRPAGDPDVMVDQLGHLVAMASRPNVKLRIFPFDRGVNPCLVSTFKVLSFPDASDSGMVYVERRGGASYLESVDEIDAHLLAYEHLNGLSLSVDESLSLLHRVTDAYAARRNAVLAW